MNHLPWLHLQEVLKAERVSLRVLFHDMPKREGKCLAELYIENLEGPICDLSKLLDPKLNLSNRQKLCVQIFMQATAFSAKRDVYALSPSQAVQIFLLANDLHIEIRNHGVVTVHSKPVFIKAVLEDNKISFQVEGIQEPKVFGVERAFLMDKQLKLYALEPVFLPSEVEALLSAQSLDLAYFNLEESQEIYAQLVRLGVDLSILKSLALQSKSQIIIRAILSKSLELRLHLVRVFNQNFAENEVEIRSKGFLEPVFWVSQGQSIIRDREEEERARQWLLNCGALPALKHRGFMAQGNAALNLIALLSKSENLPDGISVDPDCLPKIQNLPSKPILAIETLSQSEVSVQIKAGQISFSLDKLFEAASQGLEAILLNEDSILVFSKEATRTLKLWTDSLEITDLSEQKKYSFFEVALLLQMLGTRVEIEAQENLYQRLIQFVPELLPEDQLLPNILKTPLRPYQHDAVAWMSQLHRAGLGRLLADDMGLGKTLMVLCLLAKIKEREKKAKPHLVVAPTSVIDVWAQEAEKHFEGFRVLKWHGADRAEQSDSVMGSDIVITSYSLLRRDVEVLSQIEWGYFILDESQMIKNLKTESWKAARLIRAEQRLALSGTPIENRVSDLYSVLELMAPGILGDEKSFLKRYGSGERNEELKERVRPMILRRKKEEVESDLPPKIESILRCDMAPKQQALYREVLKAAQSELNQVSDSSIPLLAALTRLRQVCCDPRLLPGEQEDFESSKLDLFAQVVLDCLSMGRRVIVYSQFVKMQKLILETLHQKGIQEILWLHGGTQNRSEVVSRFQDPEGPSVIVVSLKAGGTGITLTAADTVIYYDPWWNPAVMDQAADRAHRIGQTKTVHLIKLICQNSIEEQILALCDHKRALADSILVGESAGQRSLTLEEIRQLLQVEIDRVL